MPRIISFIKQIRLSVNWDVLVLNKIDFCKKILRFDNLLKSIYRIFVIFLPINARKGTKSIKPETVAKQADPIYCHEIHINSVV
jgi:hypothetical protein